jgi:CheY-like chemotaxis protein
MTIQFPIYQHPTLTFLIDDSPIFLKSLSFQLDPKIVSRTFRDAEEALASLLRLHQQDANNLSLRVNYDEQVLSQDRCTIAVDIDQLYRQARNPHRFSTPSVLVIDYAMPQMNGLQFCQAVQHLPCKKIMFTGEGDEKVAVDAFNRGLIDRFLKKGDDDALDRLESEILDLQQQFFSGQSESLRQLLVLHSFSFLSDAAVARLVSSLSARYGFVEHYLFPNPSGILFLDKNGRATLLVMETESSLISHFEVARDNNAPPELLASLVQCQVVPFFFDHDGWYAPGIGNDWLSYCLPAQTCRGRQTYYWALFDLPARYLQGPLYSYTQYLHDQALG